MNKVQRERFDQLLDRVLDQLPSSIANLFTDVRMVVDDRPSRKLLQELGLDPNDDTLCGLYSGTPLIQRSVSDEARLPESIHIFREGILEHAGGWVSHHDDEGQIVGGEDAVAHEIRITILHELGHHFGLDEQDLERMGYD
ncbi:MAG: metallopeptidase family protein [Phycisphaerales bacterium]|nr:metallopeptidase family protein [Phycisphaerales bacterium]MCI0629133.1 metallopeptidase family protein [Phycisphaerales bacterium]MCI0675692.1 metallopeptidase family protein [Phycisphaerales bacterium]